MREYRKKFCLGDRLGFTILEMAVVLVIIGLILGAVSVGKDLQRNAEYKKIYGKFVQQWTAGYNEYYARTGVVMGDNVVTPTLCIGASCSVLAGSTNGTILSLAATIFGLMDGTGVEMPPGRAEGFEDRYAYLDTNGNPQEVKVAFQNVVWYNSFATPPTSARNVIVLTGLTPDLARSLDSIIDGTADAGSGLFRQSSITAFGATAWSLDNTAFLAGGTNRDENQVAVVTAYYRMNQ